MTDRVLVFDTTLRDGEQSPGASMTISDKMMLARQLERLNVDVIEAGFPISSDGDFESVKRIAKEVRSVVIAGLARAGKGDIDRCWEAVRYAAKPRIHVFIATSDIHLKYKLKKTRKEVLKAARQAVAYAKSLCPNVEFSAEDVPTCNTFVRLLQPLLMKARMSSISRILSVTHFHPNTVRLSAIFVRTYRTSIRPSCPCIVIMILDWL